VLQVKARSELTGNIVALEVPAQEETKPPHGCSDDDKFFFGFLSRACLDKQSISFHSILTYGKC
jgi:hypothetical protein